MIEDHQATTKVVEEYKSAQTRPLFQVVRDRPNYSGHENLSEVGHGHFTGCGGVAGRETNEKGDIYEISAGDGSNVRIGTEKSSACDHDRMKEGAVDGGGNGGDGRGALPPNSPFSPPLTSITPRSRVVVVPRWWWGQGGGGARVVVGPGWWWGQGSGGARVAVGPG